MGTSWKSGSHQKLRWRELNSNLYGAFLVKRLFWVVLIVLFGAGKAVFRCAAGGKRFFSLEAVSLPWPSACRTQDDAFQCLASGDKAPERNEQLACQRDDHRFARLHTAIGGAGAIPPVPARSPSETAESARRVRPCRGGPGRCRLWRALVRAAWRPLSSGAPVLARSGRSIRRHRHVNTDDPRVPAREPFRQIGE